MFRKVLVANRGEIACRIIRTCRRLSLETVAVYSEADAGQPHVRQADEAVCLGAGPLKDSYLNMDALVRAIRKTGADAVHPGYGLFSENSVFAWAVAEAGAVFVGPSVATLELFGDKIVARDLARSVGVEPPPGSNEPVDPEDAADLSAWAQRIGFPVLVKAAAGGGGIGMQIARTAEELERAARTCADRGLAAFGDGRIYLERYLSQPRHIEVQVFRDAAGNAVALGERDCSVQRRHQKVIEESPSPAPFFDQEAGRFRAELFAAALRVVQAADYLGAGTVEFVTDANGRFYFLEVNARLQVEHPVTEMQTGLDLVKLQLAVAAGEPLDPEAVQARPVGHSIEARVYAEDPDRGFLPQPGRVLRFAPASGEGVRVDAGIETGSEITPFYDPLLAKIIAHGRDRAEAIGRLDHALRQTELAVEGKKGPRVHNIGFLRRVLATPAFVQGDYDTSLIASMGTKG